MEAYRPEYYIETRFEHVMGYYYKQPVDYCNGKSYWDYDENSYERKNWGTIYWESYWFNDCLKIGRYNDKAWTDKNAMDKAFEIIFTGKSNGEGVYTPLKDFEIWLMCRGYEMICFDKMCKQSPCFGVIPEKRKAAYTRYYRNKETGKKIYFGFGIQSENLKFNFYFVHSDKMHLNYQTPVNHDDFERAERLELKSFQELDYEIMKEKKMMI